MDRRVKDTLRSSATAVGVAAGLLVLASTTQTPDGYIHASFGGPLDVLSAFTSNSGSTNGNDVLAIGDGTNDASELAALLKSPIGPAAQGAAAPNSPYRVAYAAGAAPSVSATPESLFPQTDNAPTATAAPTRKDAAILPSKPVVDAQGHIDCSGALSCRTDPGTNVTTVTYPDGIVAIVQKVNDLTVVAYKSITEALPTQIASLLPRVPETPTPPLLAAVAPAPVPIAPAPVPTAPAPVLSVAPTTGPVVASAPDLKSSAPETTSASIDPGPPAPNVSLDPIDSGPKLNVTTPPKDFSPGTDIGTGTTGSGTPATKIPDLGKVKDTIGGVVDAVKGAVGKVLGPGASSKPGNSDGASTTTSDQSPKSDDPSSDNSKSDQSGAGKSDGS